MLYPVKVTFKNPTFFIQLRQMTVDSDLSIITDMLDNETDQTKEFVKHIHDRLTETLYNTYCKSWAKKIPFEVVMQDKKLRYELYNEIGLDVPQQSTYIIEPIYQPLTNITFKPKIVWSNEKNEKNKYRE